MITKRMWLEFYAGKEWQREGWYLFGIIPLYVRDLQPRERRRK